MQDTERKLAFLEEWIDRLQRKAAGGWQLIESAPRISRILVCSDSGIVSIASRINTPDGTAWQFDDRSEAEDENDPLIMWHPIPPLPRRNLPEPKS
jgi:hypothetical protein